MKVLAGLVFLITIISCKDGNPSGMMDQLKLATIICECSNPILEYNNELNMLADSDNIGALTERMASGDQIMKTAEVCITNQLKTSIIPILNDELNKVIIDQCKLDQRMIDDLITKIKTFDAVTFN